MVGPRHAACYDVQRSVWVGLYSWGVIEMKWLELSTPILHIFYYYFCAIHLLSEFIVFHSFLSYLSPDIKHNFEEHLINLYCLLNIYPTKRKKQRGQKNTLFGGRSGRVRFIPVHYGDKKYPPRRKISSLYLSSAYSSFVYLFIFLIFCVYDVLWFFQKLLCGWTTKSWENDPLRPYASIW